MSICPCALQQRPKASLAPFPRQRPRPAQIPRSRLPPGRRSFRRPLPARPPRTQSSMRRRRTTRSSIAMSICPCALQQRPKASASQKRRSRRARRINPGRRRLRCRASPPASAELATASPARALAFGARGGRRRASGEFKPQVNSQKRIAAGPRMTTKSTGRKNRIIGTVNLGGSAAAFFSASDWRMSRFSLAITRSACPTGVP